MNLRRPSEIAAEYRWRKQTHNDGCLRWDHPLALDSLRRYACLLTGDHKWSRTEPDEIDQQIMRAGDEIARCRKCAMRQITHAGEIA